MNPKKNKIKGYEGFFSYFEDIYQQRWPALLKALLAPANKAVMINPFADLDSSELQEIARQQGANRRHPFLAKNNLFSHYVLDEASQIASSILPISKGDRILDMCAAPGGKALGMLFRETENTKWVLNERSNPRRFRLQKVIDEYIPPKLHDNIQITSHDASKWCLYEQDAYDAILLDAPCSSERHLLEKPSHMQEWSPARTRSLSMKQFAMLASAAAALKPSGHLLYATCSISPKENDDVIEKLLQRRSHFEIVPLQESLGETTRLGRIYLPDRSAMGPLYLCLLRKS